MTPINAIQTLSKYMQALFSDGILYFSNEEMLVTEDRKNILFNDIKVIKECIQILEDNLNSNK